MTQFFVHEVRSPLGQNDSLNNTIHQMYHFLQTSQLPASLFLWLKKSAVSLYPLWLETFTQRPCLIISISDVLQDTLATPSWDRDVPLATMKSMVLFVWKWLLLYLNKSCKHCCFSWWLVHTETHVHLLTGNCYNCDQRGSEICTGGVCRCKVTRQRHFVFVPSLMLCILAWTFLSPVSLPWCCSLQMNVEGSSCSTCKPGTFHLSQENKDGCLSCFCMGVTQQCSSSTYYRDLVRIRCEWTQELGSGTYLKTSWNRSQCNTVLHDYVFLQKPNKARKGLLTDMELHWM